MTIGTLVSTVAVAQPGEPASGEVLEKLDNGLVALIVPKHTAPGVVTWQLWMDVGSGDEAETGRTGFAHFFEHLMFHGSEAIPAASRQRELLTLGVEENAWTWLDDTVYHAVLPSPSLARYAELEADRFLRLHLTEAGVRREAGAVFGEYRKGQADPGGVLNERMVAEAFGVHPYGHDTLGIAADIEAMPDGHADALAFHDLWYRPGNATLIIVGDVDPAETLALVKRTLGAWEPGETPRPEIPEEPPQTEPRRVEVQWEAPTAPILSMVWKIPGRDPETPSESAALALLGQVLLSSTSPVKERLVREEGLAFGVWGGAEQTRDPGLFRLQVRLRDVAHFERAEAIVREEIAAVAAGVDEAKLDRVKQHVQASRTLRSDDPVALADTWGGARAPGSGRSPIDIAAAYDAALAETNAEAVAGAAARWLVDSGLTLGTLRPPTAPVSE